MLFGFDDRTNATHSVSQCPALPICDVCTPLGLEIFGSEIHLEGCVTLIVVYRIPWQSVTLLPRLNCIGFNDLIVPGGFVGGPRAHCSKTNLVGSSLTECVLILVRTFLA